MTQLDHKYSTVPSQNLPVYLRFCINSSLTCSVFRNRPFFNCRQHSLKGHCFSKRKLLKFDTKLKALTKKACTIYVNVVVASRGNRDLLLFSFWKRAESDCLHIRLTRSIVLRFIHGYIYDSFTF